MICFIVSISAILYNKLSKCLAHRATVCILTASVMVWSPGVIANSPPPENIIIGFEGMPGAGKTSTLFELIKLYPNCILLSETNPEPGMDWDMYSHKQKSHYFHTVWTERMAVITKVDIAQRIFLLDRTFYSNLAFKYAFDSLTGSTDYKEYLEYYHKDLSKYAMNLVFVLDAEPSIGLNRRKKIDNTTPFPWNEPKFLQAFRDFYLHELKKIANAKLIYINTDKLSSVELQEKIQNVLKQSFNLVAEDHLQRLDDLDNLQTAVNFACELNIEGPSSSVINVLGMPTIYFQRHSIQVIDTKPVLFNNQQLKYLLNSSQVKH